MNAMNAWYGFAPRVCALALASLFTLWAPAIAGEDQDLYNSGRTAVFEERWDDARKVLEDLTRRFPDSPYVDDAYYWMGMALYEVREPDLAYDVLKQLAARFPKSPWSDDARALRVRCAESALKSTRHGRVAAAPGVSGYAEYEAFIEKSTRDSSAKVQLLAIDTILTTRPEKAPELLPRLNGGGSTSREAAGIVLDRFFGSQKVKVSVEDQSQGLEEDNVTVLVRQGNDVAHVRLAEAVDLARAPSTARFDAAIRSEIKERLLEVERSLARSGDPGSVEKALGLLSDRTSAIVKVVDGEVHYYRNSDETTRIMVLRREAGFNQDNVKVFIETRTGVRELSLTEARGPASSGQRAGLSDATVRYLKAALAIIELDLARAAGAGAK